MVKTMKTKTTLFLAALAAIVVGCSSDDTPQTPTDVSASAPVTVNVGVGSMETRAGHDKNNLPDKFILNFAETA